MNAGALYVSPADPWDLIEFNVGFSDMTLQVAALVHLLSAETPRAPSPDLLRAALKLAYVSEASRLAGETIIGDHGFVEEEYLTDIAVSLSVLADTWALAHEAAHVLLGHTGGEDLGSVFLTALPPRLRVWEVEPSAAAMELQADALAMVLLAGGYPVDDLYAQEGFEAAFGAYLGLTALYLSDPDPTVGDEDHPPLTERLSYCDELATYFFASAHLVTVRDDMMQTRTLVERMQRWVDDLERGRIEPADIEGLFDQPDDP